jgi:hypothetical protein
MEISNIALLNRVGEAVVQTMRQFQTAQRRWGGGGGARARACLRVMSHAHHLNFEFLLASLEFRRLPFPVALRIVAWPILVHPAWLVMDRWSRINGMFSPFPHPPSLLARLQARGHGLATGDAVRCVQQQPALLQRELGVCWEVGEDDGGDRLNRHVHAGGRLGQGTCIIRIMIVMIIIKYNKIQ